MIREVAAVGKPGDRASPSFGTRHYVAIPYNVAVLRGEGVAVLPVQLVKRDLAAGRLAQVFPRVKLLSDYFRLIFRADDPRRSVYAALAEHMLRVPLQ